jgi:shikimate kinase
MKNIVLTGFMATGKSTVGKNLSTKLNMNFVDTDKFIEKKLNKKIKDIFRENGEQYFRQQETEAIKEISKLKLHIISCGGGVVLNKHNINLLRKNGIIVNLYASAQEIYKRISNNKDRPLLKNTSIQKIQELMDYRKGFYKNCDISINTDNLSVEQITNLIISKIHN